MSNNGAATRERTAEARTHHPVREERTHLNVTDPSSENHSNEEKVRTLHARRCEEAYQNWAATPPSQRPLAIAREHVKVTFDGLMHEHWLRGEDGLSNTAVARACGVDEKVVRDWRDARKPLPLAALLVMPVTLVSELVEFVQEQRACQHRRGAAMLDEAIARLERPAAPEDRAEVLRAALEGARRLNELVARLAMEGR